MSTWWAKGYEHTRDVARVGAITVHVAYVALNPAATPVIQQYVSQDPVTGASYSRQIDQDRQKDWAEYQSIRTQQEYADLGKRPLPNPVPARVEPKPEPKQEAKPSPSRDRSHSRNGR
ncbi:hypothetical protein [Nocardioides sp. W7]|uniref:hypothetical protein n=1 Tax=Nocardioides sp. W7 TaxID=2931390 RepID=UPI001FD32E89|nr:hypothetical protein [Nocardioides sp. W7]